MSHLSTPENISVSDGQLQVFQLFQEKLTSLGIIPRYVHICASGGLIQADHYHYPLGNIARTGLAYYGYGHSDLKPALRLTTRLVQTKTIYAGDLVGYDGTYAADRTLKIGILPLGYNDGLDRRLSHKGIVSLHGRDCSLIGRISMNLATIDITDVPGAEVGDEVVVIDEHPDSSVSLLKQSERVGMIPYDILVHLNPLMYREQN